MSHIIELNRLSYIPEIFQCALLINEKYITSESAKVLRIVVIMTAEFHKKDIQTIQGTCEKGTVVMFEPGTAITDPNMFKQMFESNFQISLEFKYTKGHEVFIANDIARILHSG